MLVQKSSGIITERQFNFSQFSNYDFFLTKYLTFRIRFRSFFFSDHVTKGIPIKWIYRGEFWRDTREARKTLGYALCREIT